MTWDLCNCLGPKLEDAKHVISHPIMNKDSAITVYQLPASILE